MRLELQSALCAELTEANLRGMAFDGSYFYVPLPATRQVQKLDRQLGLVATLSVNRRYDLLYWDEVDQVFWAASAEVPRTVFRLSPAFVLQETVTLATASCESTPIRSIGVNCRSNRLLITTPSCVNEYEKNGAFVATRLRTGTGVTLSYVLTMAPYTLISYTKNGRNFLELSDASGNNLSNIRTPRGVFLGALLFDPRSAPSRAAAYIAAWRGSKSMLFRQPLGVIPDDCNFGTGGDEDTDTDNSCNCNCNCGCGNMGENNCHLCGSVGGVNGCNCGNWNNCRPCGSVGGANGWGCGNWNNCGCGNVGGANDCSCGGHHQGCGNCGNWNNCGCGSVGGASDWGCGCNGGNSQGVNPCACACACCNALAQSGNCGCHNHDCSCAEEEEEEERTPCQSAVDAADDILGAINQINDALAQLLKECCDVSDDEEDEDADGCHLCGGHRRPHPGKACSLGGNRKNRLRELEQLLLSQMQTVQETESPAVVGEGGTPCAAATADQSRNASATDLVFVG